MKTLKFLGAAALALTVGIGAIAFAGCNNGENEDDGPAGSNTYTFEAEGIDVSGLTGRGYSVSYAETELIIGKATTSTIPQNVASSMSNGFCIAYWNTPGTTLTFNIKADKASEDNTITLRVSSEYGSLDVTKDALSIIVNGTPLDYNPFTVIGENLSSVSDWHGLAVPFNDYKISATFALKEGDNVIQIRTNANSMGFAEDSFLNSVSPDLDCIKIRSTSTLTWESQWDDNKEQMGLE